MEGLVGGERRNPEITEVYYGTQARPLTDEANASLISESDWASTSLSLEDGNDYHCKDGGFADETTELLAGGKSILPNGRSHDVGHFHGNCDGAISFLAEIPAILVTLMINFMAAIPFGVSYFPLGWSNDGDSGETDADGISGPFPLPGKEALGIRMFLLATITGQIVLAVASKFHSPVASQLIENVPFYHALAGIVISEQGYGPEALSTLFFLFGLSSISTGLMFLGLGKAGLGKILHYFPSHVLVGFIGGIGVFVTVSSIGVLTGEELRYTPEGFGRLVSNFGQLAPSLGFEIVLRILMVLLTDKDGKPLFGLLAPFFFLAIVPVFYIGLLFFGISMDEATDRGYFFPVASSEETVPPSDGSDHPIPWWDGFVDGQLLDVFRVVDFRTISWKAVYRSLGTVLGVSCFSVINVPINIPAFANTCKVDVDMNNELIAHGYSNMLAGFMGGIQNVMTYSVSVLFYKSGGSSRAAQLAMIIGLILIFVVGVKIIPYIPKCMAGTLLIHIGVDLFVEGICDSFQEYDRIEYGGILVIAVVMTFLGMTPALITGVIVAMTTYALQSVQNLDPIFNITTAATLRSSAWTRPPEAMAVLDSSSSGRDRILVVQLQGNLFFGNAVDMAEAIKEALRREEPLIAILDFTLVVGMDTSAAQFVNKLKNTMIETFGVATNIFVMRNRRGGYFPCEAILEEHASEKKKTQASPRKLVVPKNHVCFDFDEALIFAEDVLITFVDPEILTKESFLKHSLERKSDKGLTLAEEKDLATHYLQNLIRPDPSNENDDAIRFLEATRFLSYFQREVYSKSQIVWKHGDKSDSAKLVLSGTLVASLPNGFQEEVPRGVVIGELGLLEGVDRLSQVVCESKAAILYSLNRETWERLGREDPALARILDHITIRYLSHRVQHVSNRIYETRCLPV